MNRRKRFHLTLALSIATAALPLIADAAFTSATGFVTPTQLTVPLRQIELIRMSDSSFVTVWKGTQDLTFKRSDANFGKTPISSSVVPEGRYIGARITMAQNFSAIISGAKYRGTSAGSLSDGTVIYSVGSDASSNNSIAATSGSATLTGLRQSSVAAADTVQSTNYFPLPVCFSSGGSICASTDYKIVQTGSDRRNGATVTAPEINLVTDLFHSVLVDATNAAVAFGNSYPVVIMGTPAAMIHISASSSPQLNFSLIFSGDKAVQAIIANGVGGAASVSGSANIRVSAVPQGITIPSTGNLFVAEFNSASSGTLKFPLSSSGVANCYVTMSGLLGNPGNSVSATADTGTLQLGNYTWQFGGNCNSNSTSGLVVQRIIDTNNVFGFCAAGLCANTSGGAEADGYF